MIYTECVSRILASDGRIHALVQWVASPIGETRGMRRRLLWQAARNLLAKTSAQCLIHDGDFVYFMSLMVLLYQEKGLAGTQQYGVAWPGLS